MLKAIGKIGKVEPLQLLADDSVPVPLSAVLLLVSADEAPPLHHNCVRYREPVPGPRECREQVCARAHFNYFEWLPRKVCYCCMFFGMAKLNK